jgi:eukaryotic-like serine/threonine-protein kinase
VSLAGGTRIGVYEVVAAIGAGGMGEVYRARDTRLNRDVALKILPEHFATDRERLARFEREAQVLAALNHPHIAQIYGVEEGIADDKGPRRMALVIELVEGETLADRITRGAVPVDEALAIARQITDAIDAAHDKGIIHRDLKPANIKVTPDGVVKVLDFGLAKLSANHPNDPNRSNDPNAFSMSPTLTSPVLATGIGTLLGTAAYMSPEQARGKPVDKRADIWAFGCVLYEMLTGRRAFAGDDIGETIAAIIRAEPDWSGVPGHVRPLLESCLEKDPRRRLRDIGDAWRFVDHHNGPTAKAAPRKLAAVPWAIAAAAVAALTGMTIWSTTRSAALPVTAQFTVGPSPANVFRYLFTGAGVAPDGRSVVFSGYEGQQGANLLYVRSIDNLVARPLAGTANADAPFWSPDGSSIAFFADGKLKRLDLVGGNPFVLADAPGGAGGGTWNRDGVLLFAAKGGLYRVSASGGAALPVLPETSADQARSLGFPQFLPDGDGFIYVILRAGTDAKGAGIWASSLSHPEEARPVLATQYKAVYAAGQGDQPGHLLFVRDTTLLAQPFDPQTLTLSGDAIPITDDLTVANNTRWATFWAADTRLLMFRSGGSTRDRATLGWLDRDGRRLGEAGPENVYSSLRISPDGQRVAIGVRDATGVDDQWLFDVTRRTMTRFTFDRRRETWPVWSPDGQQLAFSSNMSGTYQLYRKDARGANAEQAVSRTGPGKIPSDWSPDGRYLLYSDNDLNDADDIWAWPLTGDPKPIPVVSTPFSDQSAQFSPDGKWIAYQSNESGRFEIYVQAFPASGGKWQVSTSGGRSPRWRADGRELFYFTPTEDSQAMMAVDIELKERGVELGEPHRLFSTSMPTGNSYPYDVTRDGQRFLVQQLLPQSAAPPLTVILNWTALLKK